MAQTQGAYYVPHGSHWPIIGSFGLLATVGGAGMWLNESERLGKPVMFLGIALLIVMMFGWFGTVCLRHGDESCFVFGQYQPAAGSGVPVSASRRVATSFS